MHVHFIHMVPQGCTWKEIIFHIEHMYHCRGYYESDRSRLGQGLPKPKIKHAKKIGETLIHKLSWGDEAGGEWLEDDLIETLSENLTSRAQM